jgi:hypothetical protein
MLGLVKNSTQPTFRTPHQQITSTLFFIKRALARIDPPSVRARFDAGLIAAIAQARRGPRFATMIRAASFCRRAQPVTQRSSD